MFHKSAMKWKDVEHNLAQTRLLSYFRGLFQISFTIFFFVSSAGYHRFFLSSFYLL